jgi:hypothetical protein
VTRRQSIDDAAAGRWRLGQWAWRDTRVLSWVGVDEYGQGRRVGLIGDAEHRRVQHARERAVELIRAGGGPFSQDVTQWSDPAGWPLPELPPDVLTVPG